MNKQKISTTNPKDRKYCKSCIYSSGETESFDYLCQYILLTGKRRNCPAGERCSQRIKKNGKNIKKKIAPIIITTVMLLMPGAASADWYTGGEYRAPDYWYYAAEDRYIGDYTATLQEMEEKREAPPPAVLRIEAENIEDADRQLETAMRYAPETVVVQFTKTADARRYFEIYRDWREAGHQIDAVIGAVWTRTDDIIHAGRSGTSVILTIQRYSDGWLSYVDTTDAIRVFKDRSYSERLKVFRETWIDTISGTPEEKVRRIADLVKGYAAYDTDEHAKMQENGFFVVNEDSHSVRGVVEKRKAVCDGYTNALQFALACHDIKSFDVILWSGSGSHSVAKVRTDGWQTVDVLHTQGDYSMLVWIDQIYKGEDG